MELPPDLDDYIHQSIQNAVGLPVPTKTLGLKLRASEQSRHRLQDQIFLLQDRLKDKDERIERLRAEASMSALALRKQIEENQRLAEECTYLESQNRKWERECTLYERDREALMEFGNDADERAKVAEIRAMEAEENMRSLAEELKYYEDEFKMAMAREEKSVEEMRLLRQQIDEVGNERFEGTGCDNFTCSQCSRLKKENQELLSRMPNAADDSPGVNTTSEAELLESVILSMLVKSDANRQLNAEVAANAQIFLQAHAGLEPCQGLLKQWQSLKPSTKLILALAAEAESLQKDKEHLRINLHRAEEEVKVLFEANNLLDEENKRLLRQKHREKHHQGSESKHSSSSSSKGKRKSSPKTTDIGKAIDFSGPDSPRQPLSTLQTNSPDSKMHKRT